MTPKRLGMFLAVGAMAGAVSASAAAPPKVTLASRPAAVSVGAPWQATLVVRGPGKPVLLASLGATTRRFATRPAGARRFRARVILARPGRWALAARLGGKRFALGSVVAAEERAPELVLSGPLTAALGSDGSLFVVENERGRVVRVDTASGITREVAAGLDAPFGIAAAPDGSLVVTAQADLFRIDPASGARTTIARSGGDDLGPVTVAPDGTVYVAIAPGTIARAPLAGGSLTTLAEGLAQPHGLALRGGSLLVTDTGTGRVLAMDTQRSEFTPVASGLRMPGGLATLPDGRLLVVEMGSASLAAIDASGAVTQVAQGLGVPVGVVAAPDGTAYVVSNEGRIRVVRDGVVRVLGLRLPP